MRASGKANSLNVGNCSCLLHEDAVVFTCGNCVD
jgi:hypothetical protein